MTTDRTTALEALREVVDSQVAFGHPMTVVPTDVLVQFLDLLERAEAVLEAALLIPGEEFAGEAEAGSGLTVDWKSWAQSVRTAALDSAEKADDN